MGYDLIPDPRYVSAVGIPGDYRQIDAAGSCDLERLTIDACGRVAAAGNRDTDVVIYRLVPVKRVHWHRGRIQVERVQKEDSDGTVCA